MSRQLRWLLSASVLLGLSSAAPAEEPKTPTPFDGVRLRPEAQVSVTPGQLLRSLAEAGRGDWKKPASNEEKLRGGEDAYARVAPAVVVVRTRNGHGTGFIIDPAGWIITNHHVAADAALDPETRARMVTVHIGRLEGDFMKLVDPGIPAIVYKSNEEKDLALLKLTRQPAGVKELPVVPLAKTGARPGAECIAIGHPAAGLLWTLRTGVVSGVAEWPEEMLTVVMTRLRLKSDADREKLKAELSAARRMKVLVSNCGINPGDSGGPLVNATGEPVAVTFAVPKSTGGVNLDKLAYHVHIDEVRAFLKDRPTDPELYLPDPWPPGVLVDTVDLDGDGIPDTLVFGMERGKSITGLLMDLNQDTRKKFNRDEVADPGKTRAFSFAFAFHKLPEETRAYYDTDNDGKIDLVLIDTQLKGKASVAFRLVKGRWEKADLTGEPLIDPDRIKDKEGRERFNNILKAIAKKAK